MDANSNSAQNMNIVNNIRDLSSLSRARKKRLVI